MGPSKDSDTDTPTRSKSRVVLKAILVGFALIVILVAGLVGMVKISLSHSAGEFTEARCGGVVGGAKLVLVAYASKYGSTGDIANAVGQELCNLNAKVDVLKVDKVTDIDRYDAVVLGSPIYWGSWLPSATEFLDKYHDALAKKAVAVFVVSNTLREGRDNPKNRDKVIKYFVQPTLADFSAIRPLAPLGLFGGKVDSKAQTTFERVFMTIAGYEDNDSRDFVKIKSWAHEVGPLLLARGYGSLQRSSSGSIVQ